MSGSLRVLVVVDEANLMWTARGVNKKPDWLKIREYLASEDEGRECDSSSKSRERRS